MGKFCLIMAGYVVRIGWRTVVIGLVELFLVVVMTIVLLRNRIPVVFICKCLATVFYGIMWLWRKVFRVSSSHDDSATDAESRARRKAEEKRQARLEKEQLEEEERKQREEVARLVEERRKLREQREEVARLVEERRKLRDEITEAETDRGKASPREKSNKKETEKETPRKKERKRRDRVKATLMWMNSKKEQLRKSKERGTIKLAMKV